jgi:hypothetical protein
MVTLASGGVLMVLALAAAAMRILVPGSIVPLAARFRVCVRRSCLMGSGGRSTPRGGGS